MEGNYRKIIDEMIEKNLSIREMANILKIPKSTLHYRLEKYLKAKILDLETEIKFRKLMSKNKDNMQSKGGKINSLKNWTIKEKKDVKK